MHGPFFAPIGELIVVDDGERVVCHLCGQALMMLSTSHLRRHGWTAEQYREAAGLSRSTALCSPAVTTKRRELGLVRYQGNQRLREGLAVGQRMARDGSLLELSHAAQPAGSARPETRMRLGERARTRDSAGPVRHRIASRLAALGFAGDLSGYLHDRYDRQLLPILAIARELGVGNARIQTMLDEARVQRRRPGGARAARGFTVAQERDRTDG